MEIPIESKNLKQIREELGLTQMEMADILEIGNSTADIERGKSRLQGKTVMRLLKFYNINPLWLYGESDQKTMNVQSINTMPKVISVNNTDVENIVMVSAKASAGYGQNISNEKYIESLPSFSFPLPEYRNASFRGFQIAGDSMNPLVYDSDWVLAKAVENLHEVIDNKIYIIVENDSIRLKKIQKVNDKNELLLISLNPEYSVTHTDYSNILEMWEYHSKISFGVDKIQGLSLLSLSQDIQELKNKLS